MFGKALLAVGLIVAFGAVYLNSSSEVIHEDQFMSFISEYRRSYFSQDEYNMRLGVFSQNLKKIEEMNANPDDRAVYAVNNFADWTHEEFMKLNSLIPREKVVSSSEEVKISSL